MTILLILMLTLTTLLLPTRCCYGYFPLNQSSYLNFHIPNHLRQNESYPHHNAMFGEHYGLWGRQGSIVLPIKIAFGSHLCTPPTQKQIVDEWKLNDVVVGDSSSGDDEEKTPIPYILVVERGGGCSFVKKVRQAQIVGAAGVLIADPKHNHDLPLLANDGSGQDISIPSMMIGKDIYDHLDSILLEHHGGNHTTLKEHAHVVAEMAWHTPKFDNKVYLDLWHSPIDTHTKDFLANFSFLAQAFDLSSADDPINDDTKNLLDFHAHPVLLDGKQLGCTDHHKNKHVGNVGNSTNDDDDKDPCHRLCTNGGRYCHVSHRHTDGRDVVLEALRRLCIRKHYPSQHTYWQYIKHFSEYCWDYDYFANDECVKDAYQHSMVEENVIHDCIVDSGNYHDNVDNTLLEESLNLQKEWGIFQSPTVLMNHDRTVLWGGLTPKTVLVELCETFNYGEKPHVCYACMMCGDPVACAKRTPMKCLASDGEEKEDPNAHGGSGDGNSNHSKKRSHIGRWLFGILLVGGAAGAFFYYKKQQEGGDGLGSYSLQDAFLTERD